MAEITRDVPGAEETQKAAGDDHTARAASASGSFRCKPRCSRKGWWYEIKGVAVQTNSLMGLKTCTQLHGRAPISQSNKDLQLEGVYTKVHICCSPFCALGLVLSLPLQIILKLSPPPQYFRILMSVHLLGPR